MVERDFDDEHGLGRGEGDVRHTTDESLGMEGIEVRLDEYPDQNRPNALSQTAPVEESKSPLQSTKSRIEKCCPFLTLNWLAPYF